MCTELTKTYDDMIGLRQLLYICKAEKTYFNDKVVTGGYVFNELLQANYKRYELQIFFV